MTFLGAPELEHGTGETYVERNKDTRDREEAKPRSRLESSSHSPPRSKTLSDFSPSQRSPGSKKFRATNLNAEATLDPVPEMHAMEPDHIPSVSSGDGIFMVPRFPIPGPVPPPKARPIHGPSGGGVRDQASQTTGPRIEDVLTENSNLQRQLNETRKNLSDAMNVIHAPLNDEVIEQRLSLRMKTISQEHANSIRTIRGQFVSKLEEAQALISKLNELSLIHI